MTSPAPVEHTLRRILDDLQELKRNREFPWWEKPVFTTEEAMEYIGSPSMRTFHRKMKEWGVGQCDAGYWPRHKIDAAMNRIRRQSFKSNRGRKSA